MSLISLNAELRQMLKLTPQLLQSMELLQMNTQELAEYLSQATEENPLLEQEDAADLHAAYEELRQKASWIDGAAAPTFAHEEHPTWERGQLDREAESLAAFLRDQLERLRLGAPPPAPWPSRFNSNHTCRREMPFPLLVRKSSPAAIFCFRAYFNNFRHSFVLSRMVLIFPLREMVARPRSTASTVM